MFKKTYKNTVLISAFIFFGWLSSTTVFAGAEVQVLLKQADTYRQQPGAIQISVSIDSYLNDKLDKMRDYKVHVFPDNRSLVVMKSTVETGQRLLMLGDNYWLIMPRSSRPIRITPIQKLIGEASTGDIATLTWSGDYDGELLAQTDTTLTLALTAQRKGLTYSKIQLELDKMTKAPVSAKLYVQSGKLAKQALFELGEMNNRPMVVGMTLIDAIQTSKRTVVHYLQQTPSHLPPLAFNPRYLIQHRNVGQ